MVQIGLSTEGMKKNMSSGFQNPITIKDAIDKIHSRQFLLPAIQRKFTWSSSQIEMLFDSILRGYAGPP